MFVADAARQVGRVTGVVIVTGLFFIGAFALLRWLRPRVRGPILVLALIPVVVILFGILVSAVHTLSAKGATAERTSGGNPFAGAPTTSSVYFVGFDQHARTLITQAVPALRTWLPPEVVIKTIPAIPKGSIAANSYGEWNGQTVGEYLLSNFKSAQGGRQVFLLGVTSKAVYDPKTPQFAFVFGLIRWHVPQFAAVFGTRPMRVFQPDRERARLTKMMLRYIGEVVCNLQRNHNPRSVLYDPILGTQDLDRMVATLPAGCRR